MTFNINRSFTEFDTADTVSALYAELRKVESLRDRAVETGELSAEEIEAIVSFQMEDGSFSLVADYRIPSDARVEFIYRPTYACCQALMAISLAGYRDVRAELALTDGLEFSCGRSLLGHGYEAVREQARDLAKFGEAGFARYMVEEPANCVAFAELVTGILDSYERKISAGDCRNAWGENYMIPMMAACEAFSRDCRVPVFVYGTLMSGMCNDHLIRECAYLGPAHINGYLMYDLGGFPGIQAHPLSHLNGNLGYVKGELRLVGSKALARLHQLEGEGDLYKFEQVVAQLEGANPVSAFAYVYLGEVEGSAEVPEQIQPYPYLAALKKTHVWYVSYGSNMLYERFMSYIQGGRCRFNGQSYRGCSNPAAPVDVSLVNIPYDVYFGNASGSWGGSGAAFLDVSRPGNAIGRAYLITREQYEEIHTMEGAGSSWYPDEVNLGSMSGIPMKTFTNKVHREDNAPSQAYLDVMRAGLDEALFPDFEGRAEACMAKFSAR